MYTVRPQCKILNNFNLNTYYTAAIAVAAQGYKYQTLHTTCVTLSLLSARTAMWSMPMVLTEKENENEKSCCVLSKWSFINWWITV